MIWKTVRGHHRQVEMLRRSLVRGRMSHAYLFTGPEGIGKKLFAQTLAQSLFCDRTNDEELEACGECPACKQMAAGTHPDFHTVGCPEGKDVLPIQVFAGAPERRGREGLCYDLSLRPLSGTRKIAVIDDANRMNAESANALLKTLEEPPAYAMLILIAAGTDSLLPTILSRCQQVRFDPLSQTDVTELLLELAWVDDPAEAEAVAGLSAGSLATAAQLLDPALRKLRDRLYAALANESFDSAAVTAAMLAGLEEGGGDTQTQREQAGWIVRFLIEFARQTLRNLSDTSPATTIEQVRRFAGRIRTDGPAAREKVLNLLERATLAADQLQRRAPVPLCLEGLFDDVGRQLRAVSPASRDASASG